MKIHFLLTQDLESPSGLGRYFPLARELSRLGHCVTISALHSNYSNLKVNRFIQQGVQVCYVAQMHVSKINADKIYFPTSKLITISARSTVALTSRTLEQPADIVHIAKPHPMNSIAGISAKYLQGKIVFLDVDDHESASGHFTSDWQKSTILFFEKFTPKRVDHITTHNSYLQQLMVDSGVSPDKITYLPTCVDPDRLSNFDQEIIHSLRSKLKLGGKNVITFIGSLSSPSHPLELLIEIFKIVIGESPDSILLIVGGGEDYFPLVDKVSREGLSDHVIFAGRIEPSEIANYYRLSNVVIDPVYNDAAAKGRLPLKLFESWIAGVPFITGDVGDRGRVLGDPPAGVLAFPGDPRSFADGILKLFNDVNFANSIVERGCKRAELYTWDQQARKLESVYHRYLEKG